MFELSNEYHHSARIKVVGIGGGGGNAVEAPYVVARNARIHARYLIVGHELRFLDRLSYGLDGSL
ncbi:MAG: hypothetical protein M1517_08730, partial [Deltaproteobacteria bacterium]|nr:hypothetical protein [Deltaproteobacteria bacterium]